ncbi:MAG: molybdenum cofactor guanylyltransferase, partial [Myxococcota bacterium]
MADVSAVVLCGGLSSRMGRPKAWLPWRGHPMITHVVGVLGQVTDDIVVVTSENLDLPPLPARVVR